MACDWPGSHMDRKAGGFFGEMKMEMPASQGSMASPLEVSNSAYSVFILMVVTQQVGRQLITFCI